jgi:hypothetical protein
MARFFIQTFETIRHGYEIELDTDDLDEAISQFWDLSDAELGKCLIADESTGEELDFITIMGPAQ